mmetsp:Transcript_12909/g.36186  ORF Transcript_12909/g.36186 Transcript_12909/m.36186 type:complete len:359 (-) Transcript_12909:705-1781(-)
MMLSFSTLEAKFGMRWLSAVPTTACPASCTATMYFSLPFRKDLFFSIPAMLRSIASAKSLCSTLSLHFLPASRAASFTMFARSAPVKPMVSEAMLPRSMSSDISSFCLFTCTLRICSRPILSGLSTVILLSNLPGRRRAASRTSGLLVAARTMTPVFPSKPSISVRSWFRVCSLSSLPMDRSLESLPLATASISSMKTIAGLSFLALVKSSLTLLAPMPTYSSTNSLAAMLKKGTFASPATALARRVLPVPGEPTKSRPAGGRAPSLVNFPGSLRYSTTSWSSSLASSTPATSLNFMFCRMIIFLGFLMPPPCPILPVNREMTANTIPIARAWDMTVRTLLNLLSGAPNRTSFFRRVS